MYQEKICDLYLRVSLDRDGKTAIERQEADCRAWAERNGLTVRKVHIDRGRSGYKNVSRKGFDAAITAVTAGVVGVLIVWKLDRLSRKGIGEVGKALDDMERAGGRLVSVMDGLDTSNASARGVVAILAELARTESRDLGMRVGSAKRYLRRRGQWIGGQPPYGLLVDRETRKLVHDPATCVYARLIADEALSGKALVHIARLLNEHGVESVRGGEWNSSSVMQLLRSPAFAGLMPQTEYEDQPDGTRKYRNRVFPYQDPETLETVSVGEGIITLEERECILRLLEARTFPPAGKRHGHEQGKSLLTGMARCGLCGARMSKAGTSYQCSNHRMGRGCTGVSARVESIDDYVTRAFLSRLSSLEPQDPLFAVIADRWMRREDPEMFAKREAVEAEIADEEARLADLEEARYVRGEFDGMDAIDRYNRLAGRLRSRIEGLRANLLRMPDPSADISPLLATGPLREVWEADGAVSRRERLGLAIDRVEVRRGRVGARFDGDERCRIVWATRGSGAGVVRRSWADGKLEA
ncbi:recombinase family protein [Streptomyces sp. NRRL B-24572]|uniref:recombinase family protein n=1 Tax=Streptomyces sp. NRRL B-24572 TaxID=1962156 RepID=UPI000A3A781C|nr:recombinase family protein [Streptomyces sp. NRRL B-24572]